MIQININTVLIEKDYDDEHNKELNLIQMHYRICLYFKRKTDAIMHLVIGYEYYRIIVRHSAYLLY